MHRVVVWAALWLGVGCWAPGWGQEVPQRPLTLDDCVAIALANNPQVVASQQNVVTAEAGVTRARSSYYPQLRLSAAQGLPGLGLGTLDYRSPQRKSQLELSLRMDIWRLGRDKAVEQAKADLRAAQFEHAATVQDLVETVARNYYAALAAKQLVDVAQAGVESAREHLQQVKERIRLGAAADVDVYPAEDDLARAELDLIDARGGYRAALAQLKFSMGLPQDVTLELAEAPARLEERIPALDEALQVALERRPDVQASSAAVQAQVYAWKQARLRGRPMIGVSGELDRRYTDWRGQNLGNVRVDLSWTIFDGHASEAEELSAQARLVRSRAELQRVINLVGFDVENALIEVERARERVLASEKSVAAAQARLDAAQGKYRAGVGIILEVIDARAALTSAQASRVRAQYDYQVALVGLQRAMGTLPVPEEQTTARQEAGGGHRDG